jgi:septal ring factor EnvC (AmiA/AmiB activator)
MEYSEEGRYSNNFEEKDSKKSYYIGVSNIIFANNAQEIQVKFDNQKKNDLNTLKEEKDKFEKIKEEKTKEKMKLEDSRPKNEKALQELNAEIQEINRMLTEISSLTQETEASELEPFQKQEQRSKYWDELLNAM